jgi:gamma-glutamyltranspeptidase/glutathione hydrolase
MTDASNHLLFRSRRSPVVCRHACVSSGQHLASSVGLDFLRRGANAADCAIAVAATLAVIEPCSTGLGGDMFCLYYKAADRTVSCINGSGKSPAALTLDVAQQHCLNSKSSKSNNKSEEKYETATPSNDTDEDHFRESVHAITIPGAAQGWEDVLRTHGSGKFTLAQLLEPAAVLAEEGFPVGPVTAFQWKKEHWQVRRWLSNGDGNADADADTATTPVPLTVDGKHTPAAGDIFSNPDMARVLRDLGRDGAKAGFYEGQPGRAIIESVQKHGGTMTAQDLSDHTSMVQEPICVEYRGIKLWQAPPNGQGVAGLIALAGLQHLEDKKACPVITPETIGSADAHHAMVEMMRLGFADAKAHVACPDAMQVENDWLVDPVRIGERAEKLFDPDHAGIHGMPDAGSCTISFQVVDNEGNAISFVNSNYLGFGSGLVPDACGFSLQNRGAGFSLQSGHPNALAPSKRPYHTIIPGMLTHSDTGELYATLSNMGGDMQPQGHMQLTVDMIAGGLDPQAAVDMPRFCILGGTQGGIVVWEDGITEDVLEELKRRGHYMRSGVSGFERSLFGRAQIIKRDRKTGVLWAGSDGRADGCAMGF